MKHYIDKSAIVAEIKRQILAIDKMPKITDTQISVLSGNKVILTKLLSFIDALEVKVTDEVKIGETQIYLDDDGGEQPYDGKQWLDLSCIEYEIPKALFNDGDNVEILIRKTQKGE